MTTKNTRRTSNAASVAKIIRSELKGAFPGVKFSVGSETYAGGDSVSVSWFEGPTDAQVREIAGKYEGGAYCHEADMYVYHHLDWDTVRYVKTNRKYTAEAVHIALTLSPGALEGHRAWGQDFKPLEVAISSYDNSADISYHYDNNPARDRAYEILKKTDMSEGVDMLTEYVRKEAETEQAEIAEMIAEHARRDAIEADRKSFEASFCVVSEKAHKATAQHITAIVDNIGGSYNRAAVFVVNNFYKVDPDFAKASEHIGRDYTNEIFATVYCNTLEAQNEKDGEEVALLVQDLSKATGEKYTTFSVIYPSEHASAWIQDEDGDTILEADDYTKLLPALRSLVEWEEKSVRAHINELSTGIHSYINNVRPAKFRPHLKNLVHLNPNNSYHESLQELFKIQSRVETKIKNLIGLAIRDSEERRRNRTI